MLFQVLIGSRTRDRLHCWVRHYIAAGGGQSIVIYKCGNRRKERGERAIFCGRGASCYIIQCPSRLFIIFHSRIPSIFPAGGGFLLAFERGRRCNDISIPIRIRPPPPRQLIRAPHHVCSSPDSPSLSLSRAALPARFFSDPLHSAQLLASDTSSSK